MSKNHFLQTDKWIRQKQKRKKVWRGQKERMKSLMFQRCAAFSKFDLMSYVVKRLGIHYIRNDMKWGNFSKRGGWQLTTFPLRWTKTVRPLCKMIHTSQQVLVMFKKNLHFFQKKSSPWFWYIIAFKLLSIDSM